MKRGILAVLLLMTALCGCSGTEERLGNTAEDIRAAYARPYRAECAAAVKSNKGENAYTFTLDWKAADTYQLQFDGMTVAVGGGRSTVSGGNGVIDAGTVEGILPLLPGAFLQQFFAQPQQEVAEQDGLLVLEAPMEAPNPYRAAMRLYLNSGRLTPVKLTVLDGQGTERIQVDFLDFTFEK